jgi:hypothetical protein
VARRLRRPSYAHRQLSDGRCPADLVGWIDFEQMSPLRPIGFNQAVSLESACTPLSFSRACPASQQRRFSHDVCEAALEFQSHALDKLPSIDS